MKLAVISDIHGNAIALEAVLKAAKNKGIEHLLVLGDMVGYYYSPSEVLDQLSVWSHDIIKGNHETILNNIITGDTPSESVRAKYGSGHDVAIGTLSDERKQYLVSLPDERVVEHGGLTIQMCHGSPWDPEFYLYPDADRDLLMKADNSKYDFVLFGHSHYAFCFHGAHSLVANPGSVGQSRQVGGLAYWMSIDTENRSFQMNTSAYDTAPLKAEAKRRDPENEYLIQILDRR